MRKRIIAGKQEIKISFKRELLIILAIVVFLGISSPVIEGFQSDSYSHSPTYSSSYPSSYPLSYPSSFSCSTMEKTKRTVSPPEFIISDETKLQLAQTYAPILWFYKDASQKELFTLIEADYFIEVSYIDYSGNYKLLKDGYSGSEQLQSAYDGVKNPVYIHVTTDEYQNNTYIVVQYWFLYLYNYSGAPSLLEWDHEGEWEMIEVILEYSEKIFSGVYPEPYMVAYSRHSGGETHTWENEWIEKEGYHPVAYIAYGTHAAYFKDLEWNEDLNKGIVVTYVDMNFITLDGMEWLPFSGRWGGQENSPLGPFFQDIKWLTPVSWAMKYLDNYLLHLERPAHLLVTNEKGQRIGFYRNQFINEIQDAYVVMTDGHESYYLPQDTYSVEIDGFDDGEIDFDVIVTDEGEAKYMSYNEVVTHLTKVYSQIGTDLKEYVLTMDKNGDGVIDFTMKPHLITFTGRKYPFLVYAVAVVLTVILYKIQRKSVYFLAAMFFLLWFIAATNDLGNFEYETEFLLCGIGIFLGLQIPPAFKKQTFKEKIQRLFTGLGLSLLGMWIAFMVLLYGGWVGSILPMSIHYFLVGILFLIISYLMKSKK